jgi:sarcosine oxidase subunit beta
MFGKRKRYWDSVPLPTEREAVIIGGGVHGLSAAFFLAESQQMRSVSVLDAGWIGGGNSGRSLGILRADPSSRRDRTGDAEGMALREELLGTLRLSGLFHPRGVLTLAHDPDDMAEMRRRAVAGRVMGLDTFLLDPLACRELAPALDVTDRPRRPILGGLYHPPGGVIRADRVLWELARAAAERGVALHEGVTARRIGIGGGGVVSVETDAGTVRTPRVLLAAGPGSAALAKTAGLSLPILTGWISALATWPLQPLVETAVVSPGYGLTAAQAVSGEIWLGPCPEVGFPESGFPESEDAEALAAGAAELMPCLAGAAFARRWGGPIDRTPDGLPLVDGHVGVRGLFVDCGWGGRGFQSGPPAGRWMADFMATGRRPDALAAFGLSRFVEGDVAETPPFSDRAEVGP